MMMRKERKTKTLTDDVCSEAERVCVAMMSVSETLRRMKAVSC